MISIAVWVSKKNEISAGDFEAQMYGESITNIIKPIPIIAFFSCMIWSLCACKAQEQPSPTLTATNTPVPTQTQTPTQTSKNSEYLKVFEEVWGAINENYFDPKFGGLDWDAVHTEYEPLIGTAENDEAFYWFLNKMLFELKVSHIGVLPPAEKEQLEPVLSAEGSAGIDIRLLDGEAVITSVQPGSSGDKIGLKPGMVVQSVNGKTIEQWASEVLDIPPYHERNQSKRLTSKLQEQFFGPLNTKVDLVYLDTNGETHSAVLQREPRGGLVNLGDEFPAFYLEFEARQLDGGIGYIRFNAFLPSVDQRFAEALKSFQNLHGLIIDLRGNHGGIFPVRKALVDQIVAEKRLFWSYYGRESIQEVYVEPQPNAYGGPLVVLIDVLSASSAEEFSGGLQAIGRARIIGERSAGICLTANVLELSNGAILMYPFAQTRTADGTVLEGGGVIPDIAVSLERRQLLGGIDSQLQAAIDYIRTTAR